MSRPFCLLSALSLLALTAAPGAARDDAPEVKTGLRVVASVTYLPGIPTAKVPAPVPANGVAVKVFAEGGNQAVVAAKTDDKGMLVVALPAGKYRVEADPTAGTTGAPPVKLVEVKEGKVSEVAFHFVIPLP